MKILFIEPCHVNFSGYFRAFNICNYLSRKGLKVDLLSASGSKFYFSIKKKKINENFTRYELPRFYFHFFVNGRILRGVIALIFGIVKKYDIIHACVPVQLESNIPAFFLKLIGKKVVMDWDDYWSGSTIYGEYFLMKRYVSFCEKMAPSFFNNMVVVSDFLKKLAVSRGAKNVLKLINGVNEEQFTAHEKIESRRKLNFDLKGKYLLTFGNTYINDRAYLLFKTFEYIYKQDKKVKLLINFNADEVVKAQNLQGRIDLECLQNVINIGYPVQEDLGYYLGSADLAIFLMGDAENERACFPIRIGSYLNGESVIAINDINSEVGNVLKAAGCAIMDRDIEILAKKIIEYLDDKELQKILKEKTKAAKRALSWETIIEDLVIFYQNIK